MRTAPCSALLFGCVVSVALLGCTPNGSGSEAARGAAAANDKNSRTPDARPGGPTVTSTSEASSERSSLIRILVHPDSYHGKKVHVTGFLRVQHEGDAIYLSKEDDQYSIKDNALWVSFENNAMQMSDEEIAKQFGGKYVSLSGTFDKEDRGHFSSFEGTIKDLTHLRVKLDRSELRKIRDPSSPSADEPEKSAQRGD